MAFGCALIISGFAFLLGALGAEASESRNSALVWFYVAGGLQILIGLIAPFVDDSLLRVHRRPKVRFAVGVAVVVGAVFASSRVAVPSPLPGIALGWPLLFHIERGAAVVGAIGLIALVAWRGAHNEWPTSFGNLFQYASKRAVEVTAKTFSKQEERITQLEVRHHKRISAVEEAVGIKPPESP